jgi:transcriptional regulator of acetoin/glycerol metabolism
MFQLKMMHLQLQNSGLRIGDSCTILPAQGKKKAFTLNRKCIDLVSHSHRPGNLAMAYVELPRLSHQPFHYRLELDETGGTKDRFVMKTLAGHPFSLNGIAVKEAYIERQDRLLIEDHRVNFAPDGLNQLVERRLDHPVLSETRLLQSDLKILIVGETGTGKTHLAYQIHRESKRSGEFVSINLASFNPQLIESELFGHRKGAFTGALADKVGAFAQAQQGTLFLDEIDSLPLELQTKLLTFMDNRKFRRVGETKEEQLKARLIFASGRKLDPLVDSGLMRKDFLFRLKSGHCLELASLRNDIQKIEDLCIQFGLEHGVSLTPRLVQFYQTLAWPGNIRQLQGHLDKKRILSRGLRLDFDELDEELLLKSSDLSAIKESEQVMPLQQLKADYARRALSLCEGNLSLAARKLRVSQKTVKSLVGNEVS